MPDKLECILESWRRDAGVDLTKRSVEGRLFYELSWRAPNDLVTRYIDVFPDAGELALVQPGVYAGDAEQRHRGSVSTWRYADLPKMLGQLRPIVDRMVPQTLRYTPEIRTGTVSGLKF